MGASIWTPSSTVTPALTAQEISFLFDDPNAVQTTVWQVLNEFVSVFRFMTQAQIAAVTAGTMTVDVTVPLQNALLFAREMCCKLFFPPGGYKISSTLIVTAGITLQGASSVTTIFGVHTISKTPTRIWQATAGIACLRVLGNASVDTACDLNIFDIAFTANQFPAYNDAPVTNKNAIEFYGTRPYSAYRISIERCMFFSFDKSISAVGYDSGAGVDWQIDNLLIQRNTFWQCNVGLYANTTNADAWLVSCNVFVMAPSGVAVYLQRCGYYQGQSNYCVPGYDAGGAAATGCKQYRLGEWPDTVALRQDAGSDGLEYFIWIDSSTGYENVYQPLILDGCVSEAPCLAERQYKIISKGTRYTGDFTCSGNDIEVHSDHDSWFPTTKKFVMSGLRPRLFVAPGSTQTSGSVSLLNTTATTAFTLPTSSGWYLVYAWLDGGGATYASEARLNCDGTTLTRVSGTNGAGLTITVSGRNVQLTQNSGVTNTWKYAYNRVA